MKYIINEKTRVLHIVGFCSYTNNFSKRGKTYSSEMEAVEDYARNITICKICSRRRDNGYSPTKV